MTKALITGHTGFVGQHLVKYVCENTDWQVVTNSLDIRTRDFTYFVEETAPDIIFHLAACAAPAVDRSQWNRIMEVNVGGTKQLLEGIRKPTRLIFASSIVVYGNWQNTKPWNILDRTEPTSIYGISKRAGESLIQVYADNGMVQATSLRMCAVVGKGLTHGALKDFIRKSKLPQDHMEVMGNSPGSIKPYVHVDDVTRIMLECAVREQSTNYDVNNLCPNCGCMSIDSIAKRVIEKVSPNPKTLRWSGSTFMGDNPWIQARSTFKLKYPTSELAIEKAIEENNGQN